MLRVIQPFAGHEVGEDITDASKIEAILGSDHASFVVRVAAPTPTPEPEAESPPALVAPADTKE